MDGRFTKPVYPGDALTVQVWGEGVFRTLRGTDVVIDRGVVELEA